MSSIGLILFEYSIRIFPALWQPLHIAAHPTHPLTQILSVRPFRLYWAELLINLTFVTAIRDPLNNAYFFNNKDSLRRGAGKVQVDSIELDYSGVDAEPFERLNYSSHWPKNLVLEVSNILRSVILCLRPCYNWKTEDCITQN